MRARASSDGRALACSRSLAVPLRVSLLELSSRTRLMPAPNAPRTDDWRSSSTSTSHPASSAPRLRRGTPRRAPGSTAHRHVLGPAGARSPSCPTRSTCSSGCPTVGDPARRDRGPGRAARRRGLWRASCPSSSRSCSLVGAICAAELRPDARHDVDAAARVPAAAAHARRRRHLDLDRRRTCLRPARTATAITCGARRLQTPFIAPDHGSLVALASTSTTVAARAQALRAVDSAAGTTRHRACSIGVRGRCTAACRRRPLRPSRHASAATQPSALLGQVEVERVQELDRGARECTVTSEGTVSSASE